MRNSVRAAIGLLSGGGGSAFPFVNSEAQAAVAAMVPQPDDEVKALIDAWFGAYKAAGVLSKCDTRYCHALHTEQASKLNLIAPTGSFNLVSSATAPSWAQFLGATGNGTSADYNTGFNPSTAAGKYVRDSAHMMFWPTSANATGNIDMGLVGSGYAYIIARSGAGNLQIRPNTAGDSPLAVANASSVGAFGWDRSGSTAYQSFRNGVPIGSGTFASQALANAAITILSGNSQFSSRRVAMSGFGQHLTDAEWEAAYIADGNLLTGLGAI